ncbi:MAG: DUF3237 domain-containing protein [Ilumatobacter sp.]|jgi:hypothetical protein|uniref:DUF3237 domain-containing protein n=1 Tax=Ilumatobacter sp. TaxID=1967498 RepID=UPI002A26E4EC|nr:DUF3237 domain-containing protein [Ilumatobacter sp.]MDG1392573.1 DUF3237 domain-containing protein [Ilumatobacter sp.]
MPLDAIPADYIGTLSARTNDVDRPTVADGPFGTKVVATVSGATFVGPKINSIAPAGVAAGDWLTVLPGGHFALDVRASFRTDDGADIYVTYTGFGTRNPDGTASIRTAPRFETGDERYAWLNKLFCVAVGKTTAKGVEYDVYSI